MYPRLALASLVAILTVLPVSASMAAASPQPSAAGEAQSEAQPK
jgi:hypothetical protein